jgi:hypothetical protein
MLHLELMICAAGKGVRIQGVPPTLVCGLPPGHDGRHRDVEWPVSWIGDPAKNARNSH